ncbi:MAG: DUF167 domain-containing protein [Candidatus Saccharibacteria bacterium]|nr:DUF167 domain-containing protein [Candidatus Saccharibacteria bacterium]
MKITVVVKPGSKKGPLVEQRGDGLVVFLREKPHDGEANQALVRVLSEYFGVSKGRIAIKTGGKARTKVVEVV